MGWFSRKTTDDGQSAVDRLTQKASVSLSRRSFLKKAGVGAAVAGLSVVGMTKGSSVAHAQTDNCTWQSDCGYGSDCKACSNGTYRRVKLIYKNIKCCTNTGCTTSCVYYTTVADGACGSCPI